MDVRMIPLDALDVPSPLRQRLDPDKLEGLAASMDEVGMLQPILATEPGEGRYRLVAGYRRVAAAQRRGKREVPAVILAADADVRQVQLVENLQREDLDPLERALAVYTFMDGGKMSKVEAARKLGVPRTTLTDWLDILEVEPRFQHAVVDNFHGGDSPLTLSHLAEAKGLAARLGSPHIATVLLDAALQYRLTKAEIREVARIVRQQPHMSVREAVRALREMEQAADLAEEAEELGLGPAEANLVHLFRMLQRSKTMLTSLEHMTGRHLPEETRARLLEAFRNLEMMAKAAQERLEGPFEPLPAPKAKKKGPGRRQGRPAARMTETTGKE